MHYLVPVSLTVLQGAQPWPRDMPVCSRRVGVWVGGGRSITLERVVNSMQQLAVVWPCMC